MLKISEARARGELSDQRVDARGQFSPPASRLYSLNSLLALASILLIRVGGVCPDFAFTASPWAKSGQPRLFAWPLFYPGGWELHSHAAPKSLSPSPRTPLQRPLRTPLGRASGKAMIAGVLEKRGFESRFLDWPRRLCARGQRQPAGFLTSARITAHATRYCSSDPAAV
jgi:hypothetical protein